MKSKYIEMRNKGEFDLNLFWQYYKEQGGVVTNPNKFQEYFLYESQVIDTALGKVNVGHQERNREEILQGIDKKLGLTTLFSAEGKFIKVV